MADRARAFAPGRVNLIGEHTDYNEGLAMPIAIGEGVTVTADAAAGATITARALDLDEEDAFELEWPIRVEGWRSFVRGAVAELRRAGVPLRGAELDIHGDVPRGAGLSSSAAFEVALCMALLALADTRPPGKLELGQLELGKLELAQLCSRVENEWVGARTGLLDQIASLYGERDHALRIDFRSLDVDPVKLELGGFRLVILDSGERHSHAASGYNERRAECARACKELGLTSLRDATLEMAYRLEEPLADRVRHVVSENARVEESVDALSQGEMTTFGRLLNASHASLRDLFDVSTPAVEEAVGRLHAAGAIGVRLIGGGFGGSVLGLLPPGRELPLGAMEVRAGPGARLAENG
jgi:galactokinase